jgi:hypothetical protein
VRRLGAAALALLLLVGCGGGPQARGTKPEPTGTGTPKEEPARLEGASCKGGGGGNARNIPDFVGMDVRSAGGVERVTFRFRPAPGVNQPPSHYVKFSEELFTGKEGREANIAGRFFVQVVFGARGTDTSGEEPIEIYTGPEEVTPGFGTIQEVEQIGDFESTITWGIGLSRRACFRVDVTADHLTIEFPAG